jgi:hypothetical protein
MCKKSHIETIVHTVPVRVARIGRTYRGVPIARGPVHQFGCTCHLCGNWTKRQLREYDRSEDSSGN